MNKKLYDMNATTVITIKTQSCGTHTVVIHLL